jgi:protein-L-isoaspartate(D-aspartate) O-methyltransferase
VAVEARRLALLAGALGLALLMATGAGAGPDPGWDAARRAMVADQVRARGVDDPAILAALGEVPRHLFIPALERAEAYADHPLPIGHGQTISQPYVVALMSDLLQVEPGSKVLEIGTGSGYQAAVLSRLGAQVFTIEIVPPLADQARRTLADLGYEGVRCRTGDGYRGWPEEAPFDAIVLTAAPPRVPTPLLEQLKVGGRMVLPLGQGFQDLIVLTKTADGRTTTQKVIPVRFVPMTGEAQLPPRR